MKLFVTSLYFSIAFPWYLYPDIEEILCSGPSNHDERLVNYISYGWCYLILFPINITLLNVA